MDQTAAPAEEFDELLIKLATALKEEGKTPSRIRLIRILRDQAGLSLIEAGKVVDDFGDGVNATALAKRLQREGQTYYSSTDRSSLLGIAKSLSGLADAIDIVEAYFLRYGLKSVMGPYPLSGIIIVVVAEAILCLPILWVVHFSLNLLLLGRPLSAVPFALIFLCFLVERTWKNWRKLRSPKRWSSYDAARDRLPTC